MKISLGTWTANINGKDYHATMTVNIKKAGRIVGRASRNAHKKGKKTGKTRLAGGFIEIDVIEA